MSIWIFTERRISMVELHDYFHITISNDKMLAKIDCTDAYGNKDFELNEKAIYDFLHDCNIKFGINKDVVQSISTKLSKEYFPLHVAKGVQPVHGRDGKVEYTLNFSSDVERTSDWNFRDVMRIPSVKKDEKIANVILPTNGKDGKDVLGKTIRATPGKPSTISAGKNVIFEEKDNAFYATKEGQISTRGHYVEVHSVFQVNQNLSMETGNLDFVGSIIINGDVPTGYTVKAEGDIKIFGIVEAANIIADGSVFISEGLAGLEKGTIKAKKDIHIGYMNQGIAEAGDTIYVENSILHSECTAKNHIYCKTGNIIGGTLSAGKTIEAKDIGNRLSTNTRLSFGVDRELDSKVKQLEKEKNKLQNMLNNLDKIGKSLKQSLKEHADAKTRITLLRQRRSYEKTTQQLEDVESELEQMNAYLGNEDKANLIVNHTIYPNVNVSFGRYEHKTEQTYQNIQITLEQNEIVIKPLQ